LHEIRALIFLLFVAPEFLRQVAASKQNLQSPEKQLKNLYGRRALASLGGDGMHS